jgi:hypothetical protein
MGQRTTNVSSGRKTRLKKLTDHEVQVALSSYLEGHDPDEIAGALGVPESVVMTALADHGYNTNRFEKTSQLIDEWTRLYLKDYWTFAEIAAACSPNKGPQICPGTVAYQLARRGVRARRPGYSRKLRNQQGKKKH